jgi:hypothetical protein
MKIESTAILYLAIMFFLAVLFCKTLEIVVEWARRFFVGTNDAIDLIKIELNALNIKIDALQTKFHGKLDVLRTEMDGLNNKAQWVATEQLSVAPDSPMPMLEDAYSNGEDTWIRDVRANEASTAPTIPTSPSENTWMRDAVDKETVENDRPMILTSTSKDTWTRDIVDNETAQGGVMGGRKK